MAADEGCRRMEVFARAWLEVYLVEFQGQGSSSHRPARGAVDAVDTTVIEGVKIVRVVHFRLHGPAVSHLSVGRTHGSPVELHSLSHYYCATGSLAAEKG